MLVWSYFCLSWLSGVASPLPPTPPPAAASPSLRVCVSRHSAPLPKMCPCGGAWLLLVVVVFLARRPPPPLVVLVRRPSCATGLARSLTLALTLAHFAREARERVGAGREEEEAAAAAAATTPRTRRRHHRHSASLAPAAARVSL